MKLHYQKHLKNYSQKLRQSGNLSEALLWNKLKNNQLGYRFYRQRPIEKYIVDFYCHKLNLAIEIDGAASHDFKIDEDRIRQKLLESLGIRFMRFTDKDVKNNLNGVLVDINLQILRLTSSPPPLTKEE